MPVDDPATNANNKPQTNAARLRQINPTLNGKIAATAIKKVK
jgi:hypothetical protein